MTRRVIDAGVFMEATLVCILTVARAAADPLPPQTTRQPPVELFQNTDSAARLFTFDHSVGRSRHRFRLELAGARTQAEDWLHDAGFSLLEDHDVEGHHTYAVVSGALITDGPAVQLRARLGQPALSAGMRLRSDRPAIGVVLPSAPYSFEFEGLEDRTLGYVLMGTLRWSDPQQRVQYGLALPLAVGRGPSMGALLQLRVRFAQ